MRLLSSSGPINSVCTPLNSILDNRIALLIQYETYMIAPVCNKPLTYMNTPPFIGEADESPSIVERDEAALTMETDEVLSTLERTGRDWCCRLTCVLWAVRGLVGVASASLLSPAHGTTTQPSATTRPSATTETSAKSQAPAANKAPGFVDQQVLQLMQKYSLRCTVILRSVQER